MGVFVRPDSRFYQLWLEGAGPGGKGLKEPTDIRHDAPLPAQRRENLRLATIRYHDRMTEIAKGGGPSTEKTGRTFGEQAAWFTQHALPQRRGREREAPLIPKLVAVFGAVPLPQMTRTLVAETWITPRLTIPTVIKKKRLTAPRTIQAGPSTVNREVALIKAIVQSGVPDYLDPSPLYGMPLLPIKTPKRRLMAEDEERRLLAVMAADDTALFLLGLDSLVRLTDLLDATWADDHGDTLWIADPKAGGGFEVPISKRARLALNAMFAPAKRKPTSGYIFARRRRAKTERDRRGVIRKMLQDYCARATPPITYGRRLSGITFHWATRRTGLTRMLTRGVDLGTAQKVGRWKTPGVVLGVYHELLDDAARDAVEAVGRLPSHSRRAKTPRKSQPKR